MSLRASYLLTVDVNHKEMLTQGESFEAKDAHPRAPPDLVEIMGKGEHLRSHFPMLLRQPPTFLAPGPVSGKTIFPWTRDKGDGLGMIQAHYGYCAFYFYYYINFTSDYQASDPGAWGPLLKK